MFIIEYDRRRLGLPKAPVVLEYDSNRDHRDIAIALNIHVFLVGLLVTEGLRQRHDEICRVITLRTRVSQLVEVVKHVGL